jgi:hypothetical protein
MFFFCSHKVKSRRRRDIPADVKVARRKMDKAQQLPRAAGRQYWNGYKF